MDTNRVSKHHISPPRLIICEYQKLRKYSKGMVWIQKWFDHWGPNGYSCGEDSVTWNRELILQGQYFQRCSDEVTRGVWGGLHT